jgi:hypothetical protein
MDGGRDTTPGAEGPDGETAHLAAWKSGEDRSAAAAHGRVRSGQYSQVMHELPGHGFMNCQVMLRPHRRDCSARSCCALLCPEPPGRAGPGPGWPVGVADNCAGRTGLALALAGVADQWWLSTADFSYSGRCSPVVLRDLLSHSRCSV